MLVRRLILASAALVAAQSDEPTPTREGAPTRTGTALSKEPCNVIASLVAAKESDLPAQAAYDCLNSVPVDVNGNSELIDELKNVWRWQSEYGWLKNPPSDWENGPLDIDAELDSIKENLTLYSSEYQVQLAIQHIVTRTANFHFNYMPDILQIFSWARPVSVIALSEDGTSIPKLFLADDVTQSIRENLSTNKYSAITKINGVEAFAYLENLAAYEQFLDTDGRINQLLAKGDTQTPGSFKTQTQFDGSSTNFTFANGTSQSFDNTASTKQDFKAVADGQSFFKAYCTGSVSGVSAATGTTKGSLLERDSRGILGPRPSIPDLGYRHSHKRQIPSSTDPTAVIKHSTGAVAGYFLSGKGYDDVAVLKIITFDPEKDETNNEFQSVIKQFLAKCISEKKQKLIIDLRENGGGATQLLLDTFRQLFPKHDPFSGQRYRAEPKFKLIGDAVNEIYNSAEFSAAYTEGRGDLVEKDFRYWAYWRFRTSQGNNFDSWDEFNGPQTFNGDNFTVTMRYNYSNADPISIRSSSDFSFVEPSNLTQPFEAPNIVMFTDALCGSSCASFHEELKNTAGVRAVTVGGRARTGPIQTVTGTKGGEVIPLISFPQFAAGVLNASTTLGLQSVVANNNVLSQAANAPRISVRAGDSGSRLQSQDQVRKGDASGTPLQFIYEASDCKIFYTIDTYADFDAAWKQAWDSFTDDNKCVEGSTKHPSSISGGYKPFGPGLLPDSDLPCSNGTNSTAPPSTKTTSSYSTSSSVVHQNGTTPVFPSTSPRSTGAPVSTSAPPLYTGGAAAMVTSVVSVGLVAILAAMLQL